MLRISIQRCLRGVPVLICVFVLVLVQVRNDIGLSTWSSPHVKLPSLQYKSIGNTTAEQIHTLPITASLVQPSSLETTPRPKRRGPDLLLSSISIATTEQNLSLTLTASLAPSSSSSSETIPRPLEEQPDLQFRNIDISETEQNMSWSEIASQATQTFSSSSDTIPHHQEQSPPIQRFPHVILPDPNPNKVYRWTSHFERKDQPPAWIWVERTNTNAKTLLKKLKMVVPSPQMIHNHTQWALDSILTAVAAVPTTNTSTENSTAVVAASSKLNNNNHKKHHTSVVFYGSSHMRELYFGLIRLKRGRAFNSQLEPVVKQVGFKPIHRQLCYDPPSDVLGKMGVDMENCGSLDKRIVPELSPNDASDPPTVAIGFKTFLHTPDAEQEFVEFLSLHGLRHPTVLVVDVGIWGPRGQRTWSNSNTTHHMIPSNNTEVDYYLDWITTAFPMTHVAYVYEDTPYGYFPEMYAYILHRLVQLQNNNHTIESTNTTQIPSSLILRKDILTKNLPKSMPCGHGCAGPVIEVLARYFLGWLQDLLLFESSQHKL
jgi:hypothetical protein